DAACFDQAFEALVLLRDDVLAVAAHARGIHAPESRAHADGCRVANVIGDLRCVQQRLGRDASAVKARAAALVLLDQSDALAELGSAQCCGVTAASTAENDDVEGLCAHQLSVDRASAKATSERTVAPVAPFSVNPY